MRVFRDLLEDARGFYPSILAVSLIIVLVLIVYSQDFVILLNEALRSDAASHIILVPFLFSFLLYKKWKFVKASVALEKLRGKPRLVSVSDIVGVAICLVAFLLYWYGSYTFYPLEYHVASLIIFLMGVTTILANIRALVILIFPILFLAFLVPPPSTVVYTIGGLLANINTNGSYTLLKTLGFPVSLSFSYGAPIIALNTSTGPVEFAVYQASSGLYSLIAFTMFATFLVYIASGSPARKALLFVLGLFILPLLNIARISIIVSAAYFVGEEIAMNVFHTVTGWLLIFGGVLLLLLIGEKFLHLQVLGREKEISSCSECDNGLKKQEPFCLSCGKFHASRIGISKTFWMKIAALLIGSYLVTVSIQAPVLAFTPSLTVTNSNPQVNSNVFPNVTDYRLQFLYRDKAYENVAGQDLSLVYVYLSQNSSTLPVYVIVGVASSISNLHNWEVSLIAWRTSQGLPPLVSLLQSEDVQLTDNPRIIARFLVFQHPSNYTYVALYWYQRAYFKTGLAVEPRYIRINLLAVTRTPNDTHELREKLTTIGQSVIAHWEPLRIQSLVSIGIPMEQFLLGSTVMAAVFIETSQQALEQKKKRTNLKIFEKFASPSEKRFYQTIKELGEKTKETTAQNIASAFEKTMGRTVRLDEVIEMLNSLKKQRILNADIVNAFEQPKLVWKP